MLEFYEGHDKSHTFQGISVVSLALGYNSPAGVARVDHYISASCDREIYVSSLYFHCRGHTGITAGFHHYRQLNPQSTLNNVGLVVRQQHLPCPCYTHVHVRCWRGGTTLVLRILGGATGRRLIERWVEQTERWLCRW